MSELAKILGAFGAGHVLEHAGKEYTFSAIDQRMKDALTKGYYRRAREAVYETKEEVSEAEYQARLDRVTDRYTSGAYDFPEGESLGYYLRSSGMPELAAVVTGCARADAEGLVRGRGLEVQHVLLCVLAESFPDFKKKLLQAEAGGLLARHLGPLLALFSTPPQSSPRQASDLSNSPT